MHSFSTGKVSDVFWGQRKGALKTNGFKKIRDFFYRGIFRTHLNIYEGAFYENS